MSAAAQLRFALHEAGENWRDDHPRTACQRLGGDGNEGSEPKFGPLSSPATVSGGL